MADEDGKGAGGEGGAAGGDKADPKPAVSFKSEGEFLAAVEKRSKSAITKAVDAARSEFLTSLGVESLDDLTGLKDQLAASQKTVTEAEKLKNSFDKTTKELEKERKRAGELTGRLVKIAKRDALMPFLPQVRDPEALAMFAESHLEVDDEGTVSVKNGRSVEDLVTDILKAKDYLRNPAHKDGAGTGSKEPLKANDGKGEKPADEEKPKNGAAEAPKFKSFGHAIVAGLQEKGHLPRPEGP